MLQRTANVNLIHRSALAGMESGISSAWGFKNVEKYHDDLIYTALIQSGVHRIRDVQPARVEGSKKSPTVNSRIVLSNNGNYYGLLQSVQETIVNNSLVDQPEELFPLVLFLTEMLYALKTNSSMVSVLPIPRLDDYIGRLTPYMLSALGHLLPTIERVDVSVVTPKYEIGTADVRVFEEVINSDIFSSYSEAHAVMEHKAESPEKAQLGIVGQALMLQKKFAQVVDFRRLSLSLIPVTSSIVEALLGSFPAVMTRHVGDGLAAALKNEKRITIYDYRTSHEQLLISHYRALYESKSPRP